MKLVKKVLSLVLAAVMVLALSVTAFAQTIGTPTEGKGSITIDNAAKGETYKIYKLFDATVTGTEGGSIAYTGTIPSTLEDYFQTDDAGNISVNPAAKTEDGSLSEAAIAALTDWAKTANVAAFAVSDGSELTFAGIDYGYYVVTTTQGDAAISVDSTNPDVTIHDKNSTLPVNDLSKKADSENVTIGQTVTYTVKFKTANYNGAGADAKQIVSYTITDTPAANFLNNITVTKITIDGEEYKVDDKVPQFTDENEITIPWAKDGTSLYANQAEIVITYTAVVADTAAVDGAGNTNTVVISFEDEDGNGPEPGEYTDEATIFTYAIAIQKVDQNGKALAGATFQFPFYVKEDPAADGAYIYAGVASGDGLTNTITTPDSGLIIVKGVTPGDYIVTETKAPDGYNKLTEPVTVTAEKTGETTTETTTYLNADGEIVKTEEESAHTVTVTIADLAASALVAVNKTGAELPSTGGIGTTIFYIMGSILVLGAGVVLVTRRRIRR